jgi:hypothetical protein
MNKYFQDLYWKAYRTALYAYEHQRRYEYIQENNYKDLIRRRKHVEYQSLLNRRKERLFELTVEIEELEHKLNEKKKELKNLSADIYGDRLINNGKVLKEEIC